VWNRRIGTAPLNRWLADVGERHPPPLAAGRRNRLRYITQTKARPPTFVLFASRPEELPKSYVRYLVNGLRENFDLPGVPLRLHPRKGDNPYA
jgi:GTP-binding protein